MAVSLKAACQVRAAAEHWLLPGENENIWQSKVTRGLWLYKASIAGPSEHDKVIKHFVITRYINSQQSSGITFPPLPPSQFVWLVSLDFLLALFQIQMEYVDTGRLSCEKLLGLFWSWRKSSTPLIGRWKKTLVRKQWGKAVAGCKKKKKKRGWWVLAGSIYERSNN